MAADRRRAVSRIGSIEARRMLYRQTLLYLPAQVLGPVFTLISMVAWTHVLPPAEMGAFALLTAAQELLFLVTLSWFSLYTTRYYDSSAADSDRAAYLNTETAVLIACSAISILGVLLMPLVIDVAWSPFLMGLAIVYTIGRNLATHLSDRARTEQDAFSYTVLQAFWPVLGLPLGWLAVKAFGATAAMVLLGYTVAQTLGLIIAGKRLGFGLDPRQVSRSMLAAAVKYGLPLLIGGSLVWVANNGLRFVIDAFRGTEAVGLVTVGWGLGIRAAGFAGMMVAVAGFPLALRRMRDEGMASGEAQLVRNGVLLLATIAPATAGLWAISKPLIDLTIAAEYRELTTTVLPLALLAGAFRNYRQHFAQHIFLLHEKPEVPVYNDIWDAAGTMAGALIGLWAGGLLGAVAGAMIGAFIGLVATIARSWRDYGFGLPLVDLVRIGGATLAMMLAVAMFGPTASIASLTTSVMIGGIVYVAVLAVTYPSEARRILSGFKTRMSHVG
jgi:O-antigen/teichoic acid export membrane protein